MVNFGLNSASILGLFLAVGGAMLYFIRTIRPELSRDYDIFFAAVGLLCGLILIFQGWRLDPILQFGQFLLTGCTVFFAVETLRLRGIATEQARRSTPIVDDDRPVSRVYRAELDQIEPYENEEPQYDNPRLRGYQEPRQNRRAGYENEDPRSSKNRRNGDFSKENPKSRRPNRPPVDDGYDPRLEEGTGDRSFNREPSRGQQRRPATKKPKNRSASPADLGRSYYDDFEPGSEDYVDYQPVDNYEENSPDWDQPDQPTRSKPTRQEDRDNPGNFDY